MLMNTQARNLTLIAVPSSAFQGYQAIYGAIDVTARPRTYAALRPAPQGRGCQNRRITGWGSRNCRHAESGRRSPIPRRI
eukprot:scaffold5440_cov32-Tisochrysis_lutea.AAC.6